MHLPPEYKTWHALSPLSPSVLSFQRQAAHRPHWTHEAAAEHYHLPAMGQQKPKPYGYVGRGQSTIFSWHPSFQGWIHRGTNYTWPNLSSVFALRVRVMHNQTVMFPKCLAYCYNWMSISGTMRFQQTVLKPISYFTERKLHIVTFSLHVLFKTLNFGNQANKYSHNCTLYLFLCLSKSSISKE